MLRKNLFLLVVLLLVNTIAVFAKEINGKVVDIENNEPVIGAIVQIKGTSMGAATDVDGTFSIPLTDNKEEYVLIVRYTGYQVKEIDGIKADKANSNINITIEKSKSTDLGEVVVRTTVKKETVAALYMQQKNATTVSDGISADIIKKSADKSTGEVLKRVSGTTIQDNKFVIVRGLSDRYNTALIDNSFLPSTEANRKAFSFDIIPSSLIDNIIISKSASPDLPGDFAGGLINILTKEAPTENFNTIAVGGSFNTIATFKNFSSGYRTPTDFIGFDNGARQLPKDLPAADYFAGRNTTQTEDIKYLSMLNNNFSINTRKALPGISLQGSMGRIYKLENSSKIGFTAAITYNHSENIKRDLERVYGNFNYTDNQYNYNTTLAALANVSYYFGNSKITFKNIYNRIFDDNYLYRTGYNNSSSSDIRYYAFDLIQKSLFKTSLEGETRLGENQSKLNWNLGYSLVGNNQPDQRKISYSRVQGNDTYLADITTLGRSNNRLYGDLKESIYNASLNYTLPYNLNFTKSNTFKAGALGMYRYRDFSNRYIGAVVNTDIDDIETIRTSGIDNLFTQQNIQNGAYRFIDQTSASDNYEAFATTAAAYVMSDNKINTRLRAVWGVRFESYMLHIESPALQATGQEVNNVWNDVLPSVNLAYSLNEQSNLRLSYFKSVARPELREVAPMSYYDYELNANILGKPSLTRSQINNIDLRYEIFPKNGEVFSASVFYKHFNKTLENYFYGANSASEINPTNYNTARNIGVEVEMRKSLDFVSKSEFFKNLGIYANLSYINSQVQLATPTDQAYLDKTRTSRPLSGQSPYVINAGLSYTTEDGKFSTNILYNRIGQRIFLVGGAGQFADVYEMSRNLLDFQFAYNISKRSELRLNIKDILNAPITFYYDQNDNKKFDAPKYSSTNINPKEDYILMRYLPGTTFSLTYTYKF